MLYSIIIFLWNRSFNKGLSALLKPEYLYLASLGFFLLTLCLIAGTYRILYLKRKKHIYKTTIRLGLEEWITETIINESTIDFTVPEKLTGIKKTEARQMLLDELVRNKGNFLGIDSDNIIRLYNQLGLNIESGKKLGRTETHIQCQGIHELSVMEQKDQLQKVYRLTNSMDKDVRIEAQTAILQWYGFKGLRFLDVVTYPITEFQQLRLLELLRPLQFNELPKLKKWLTSSNDSVVNFSLKLAEHYEQSHVMTEAGQCLYHKSEEVRVQAVKTLVSISNASTASLLTNAYPAQLVTNKLNILKQLLKIADNEQRDFLIVQLHEGVDYLKLAAARVLAKCITDGMEILEAKSHEEPLVYREIYLHVKCEVSR